MHSERKKEILIHEESTEEEEETLEAALIAPSNVAPQTLTNNNYLGLILAICSCLFFSAQAAFVKIGTKPFGTANILIGRGIIQSLAMLFLLLNRRAAHELYEIPENAVPTLLIRSFCGCGTIAAYFTSLGIISIADATVCRFTTPVWTLFVAYFALGERIRPIHILCCFLALVGVTLVARPTSLLHEPSVPLLFGMSMAILSSMFQSIALSSIRKLASTGIASEVIIFYFGIAITLLGAIWQTSAKFSPALLESTGVNPEDSKTISKLGIIVAVGLCGVFGSLLINRSLQLEKAGPVSIARCSDLLFVFIIQLIWFPGETTVWSILGAIFMVTSSGLNFVAKSREAQASSPPTQRSSL